MKLRKFLSLLLCLCMAVTLLPMTVLAEGAATVKYINATAFDGDSPTAFEFADDKGDSTIAVFVYGAADNTYITTEDDAGLFLFIDNAAVTVGENGVPGEFRLSGTAQLQLPTYTVTAGNCPALSGEASDINNVVGFYTSAHYDGESPTAVYSYTVTTDTELDDFLTAYDLTIQSGNTLTINAPSGADAPDNYRLTVTHALNVSGTLTAAEGQALEIGEDATVSGLTLYEGNGTDEYTFAPTHFPETFIYTNVAAQEQPADWRWVRQNAGGGEPAVPDDGYFTIDWNDGVPQGGTAAATVIYQIGDGGEVTATRDPNNAADVEIGMGLYLTISVTPAKDSDGGEVFWGIRVTRRGDNTASDVPKTEMDEMDPEAGTYTHTIERDTTENAGLLVEVFESDPNQGGGGDGEPQNDPTYRVRWDWNALEVKLGTESFDDQNEGQELNYPATDEGGLVFTFKAKAAQGDGPANMFYGLKVTEVGETPTVTYIKAATLTGNATDGYTYTIPEENFDKSIEIEAISWAAPFNNEFIVFYDNPDGTAGVSYTGGSVTAAPLNDSVVTEFASDTAYTFTLTPPTGVEAPHKVQIEPNDGVTAEQTVTGNSFTYTPTGNTGFKVRIYWTEAQKKYETLSYDNDTEYCIEYYVDGNGGVTYSPAVATEKAATYNGRTRVVFGKTVESVTFTLTPDATPNEIAEVRYNGAEITAPSTVPTYSVDSGTGVGTLTIPYNVNEFRYDLEFRFTGDSPTPPAGDTFTITTSVAEGNGTIDPTNENVEEQSDYNVTITPDYGWKISSVVIDGDEGSGGSSLNEAEIEAVTRDGFYTFNDVSANHTIAVTFVEDQSAGEFADFAALKTYIESYIWAYWTDNISTSSAAESMMVDRLWDVASHEYEGAFVNKDAVTAAMDVTEGGTDTTLISETSLDYYAYSVMLKNNGGIDDIVATGKIYKLEQKQDFILSATKGGNTSYTIQSLNLREGEYAEDVSPCIDTSFVVDYDTVTVVENDESREVPKIAFYGIQTAGGTGHTDYSDSFHVFGANYINCQIILYKPEFAGVLANPEGEEKRAPAWDFGNYPFVCLNDTTVNNPFVLTTYFGYSSITLSIPDSIALHSITNMTTTLPEGAVTIDQDTKAITFNSDFYDTVPLVITYDDGELGYLTIKRVGIDIQAYGRHGDEELGRETLHGTQPGVYITWEDDDYAIYATYYYPSSDNTSVDLYTTYTWADGRVETRLLAHSPQLYTPTDSNGNMTPSDDFCVYKGLKADCPVSVSVIAVKTGGSDTTFAGAKLGSSAGVTWEYAVGIEN